MSYVDIQNQCLELPVIIVTKFLFSDVGMEKEQKQELGWRVSVLPIPAFRCTLCTCNT